MAKILIVDDEIGIRELLSEILRDEGHDIILAENAGALKGGSLHFALLHISQAGVVRRDALLREHNIAVIPFNDFAEVVPFLEALARA